MVSYDSCLFTLVLVSASLVVSMDARSWDLAVTIGHKVEFFAKNGTLTGQLNVAQAVSLSGIAYDDATRIIYLSDSRSSNASIYTENLSEKNHKPHPLLKKERGTLIVGMVFDVVSRTLFWIDARMNAVMTMHLPLNDSPGSPNVLHKLENLDPQSIALDVCNRLIYWTNSNQSAPSIERSKLDGSERTTVVSTNLYEPVALAIDHATGKLYWADDEEGIYYKIERSNLDGSEREMLVHGKHHQPVSIAVDQETIYWTDWTSDSLWAIKKDKEIDDVPFEMKSYHNSYSPGRVITRDNVGHVDCKAMFRIEHERLATTVVLQTDPEIYKNLTTSTEEIDYTTPSNKLCMNDGLYNELDSSCHCKPGYNGALCEIPLCHNYCVHGNCVIDSNGSPRCECGPANTGSRCESNVCDGYCLNNGRCSVSNGKPICTCKHSGGRRCEDRIDIEEICSLLCMSEETAWDNLNITLSCRCSKSNQNMTNDLSYNDNFVPNVLLPTLVALISMLTVVIAVLSYHVNKLRRRPRIKKRFVVSKSGVTPLTSRPQIPGDQCEITIENCCNMNICETPCFEPKLRSAPAKNSSNKKEEKNSLLDSMEGGESC